MTTLTLIGEPFPDWEADLQRAAAEDLTRALAAAAPRACAARLLLARGRTAPQFSSPKATVEALPLATSMLPMLWQSGATARPLDGELVHAVTPMIPLRSRHAEDGSQTSVTVPHALAWEAPALIGSSQARLYRSFVRRAVKYADVIVTPTYAVAEVLQQYYGESLPVQVLPLAPPSPLLRGDDAVERRTALGVPDRYIVTTATASELGRLDWILKAMAAHVPDSYLGVSRPGIPHLVVIDGLDPAGPEPGRKAERRAGDRARRAGERERRAGGPPPATPSAAEAEETAPVGATAAQTAESTTVGAVPRSTGPGTEAEASVAERGSATPDSTATAGDGSDTAASLDGQALDTTADPAGTATAPLTPTLSSAALREAIPPELQGRVTVVQPRELDDIGAVLSGAELLVQPQSVTGSNYTLLAALTAGVPTLHAASPGYAETALDAGVSAEDEQEFAAELLRLTTNPEELQRLSVLASDRSRAYSWAGAAWSLWELHANL